MADSPVVQVRVPEGTLAEIDEVRGERTRSSWILDLIGRELTGTTVADVDGPLPAAVPVSHQVPPGGIDSAGVACSWSACWARDTRRYGVLDPSELTRTDYRNRPRDEEMCGLALCPAHAARLDGFRYVKPHHPLPRATARTQEPA